MPVEIERKFLVKGEFRHLAVGATGIFQAYLSVDPGRTVRLRIAGDQAFITIKGMAGEGGVSRKEWELPLSVEEAEIMKEICLPGKIEKTRYLVPSGRHCFEVDVFHGKNEGLIIAELELGAEDEYFEKPGWLGEEVTGRPEYYNSNLVK